MTSLIVFVIGCFGLPWLWLLNALYFYPNIKDGSASANVKACKNKRVQSPNTSCK
jgi:hypothetical protein